MRQDDPRRGAAGLLARALIALVTLAASAAAQTDPKWTEPYPPFRVAGNLYYVGSRGLANFLVTTPQGHILINSDLEANVPLIRASVEKLGFKFADIRILLISHAHWDHDAGSAMIKQMTGAKYMVMDADVPVVTSGGKSDFQYGDAPSTRYAPAMVDRVLHDGDQVELGDAVLVAHLTPGHTKGCTTWTMRVKDGGTTRDVVIVGSPNVNEGYKLVGNTAYPEIVDDYERTFRVLKSLKADYFLGAHGSYFDMEAKVARLKAGTPSPFIDAEGYRAFVAEREQAFRTELARQVVDDARAFMDGYAHDLIAGDRDAIAGRYDRIGAYRLGNGRTTFQPYDSIAAGYRNRWSPPASFTWHNLSFEAVGPDAVAVAGQFAWIAKAGMPAQAFSYSALLRRQDGVLRIRVEDESADPRTLPPSPAKD